MGKKADNKRKIFPTAAEDVEHACLSDSCETYVNSSSYRLAYDDKDFIMSDDMRGVRLMLEHSKTEITLTEFNIENTIVIFGSARTLHSTDAEQDYAKAVANLKLQPDNPEFKKQLFLSKGQLNQSKYYKIARAMATLITERSLAMDGSNITVITGGGPGIMEAANRGAFDAGGKSIGLNIVLPREQTPNTYITPELCFRFHYFAMRKLHFLLRARALIVFPGGFGTLDELFETLTLIQTRKIKPLPILLFGQEYWQRLINFDVMVEEGMIDEEDLQLFSYVETVEQAWEIIEQHLTIDI